MLFSKPIADLTFEDVEEFCNRFRENIRVEYKSTFDDSVKKKLPRVLSSFANSYGGILIIGINTKDGIPREPFDGIAFDDREPRLTVENKCRQNVFPEVTIYQKLVPSRVPERAFLVVQINESPKAPHAIENATQVYVRTGDSANPTTLADMAFLERTLLRRREVLERWDDFFAQSWTFARTVNIDQRYAYFEIRSGPLYPSESLLSREAIYEFLGDPRIRELAGFRLGQILRSPIGALLARDENVDRFLNVGELGILHYVEPFYPSSYQGESKQVLDFWPLAIPIQRMLKLSSDLVRYSKTSCDLRVEAHLRNISGQSLYSGTNPHASLPIATVASSVSASVQISSDNLVASSLENSAELMYQLRWPFGKDAAPTRESVREVVRKLVSAI
jgi:hypothetical protein